ncbi:MAG TPA: hypothetical protein VF596_09645 [Pyrinomonadaceae bacterium]
MLAVVRLCRGEASNFTASSNEPPRGFNAVVFNFGIQSRVVQTEKVRRPNLFAVFFFQSLPDRFDFETAGFLVQINAPANIGAKQTAELP